MSFACFSAGYKVNPITEIVLDTLLSGEYIGILPLANERCNQERVGLSAIHLFNCNYSPSFEDFRVHHPIKNSIKLYLYECLFALFAALYELL